MPATAGAAWAEATPSGTILVGTVGIGSFVLATAGTMTTASTVVPTATAVTTTVFLCESGTTDNCA
jgi:hypothetical protein